MIPTEPSVEIAVAALPIPDTASDAVAWALAQPHDPGQIQ
jgi:hypothetical protein